MLEISSEKFFHEWFVGFKTYRLEQWFSTFFGRGHIFHKIIFWRHIFETEYHDLNVCFNDKFA
jgi:hypothetical protein